MAINPEADGLVTTEQAPEVPAATNGHLWPTGLPAVEIPALEAGSSQVLTPEPAAAEPAPAAPSRSEKARRPRPRWLVPTTIAVIGLIVSGMLGYFLYATIQQRDGTRRVLAKTAATLATTQQQLTAAQADAAAKKKVAGYVALYIADNGKVQTDYQSVVVCTDYSSCRTAAQQMLTDMQSFQKDRAGTNVPDSVVNSDSATGDSLSAGIAGVQELIAGMDNDDLTKIKDGGHKVDAAMLNLDKAEQDLASSLS